jgi:predicted XRE-type DNA-binding protein
MTGREETSALDFLDSVIEATPKVQRAARRERLRLELARFMRKAREEAGLSQREVAEVLGVTQAWVSKLESPNHDHKLESVLSYFDAIGGEMKLSVDVGTTSFQVWGEAPVWSCRVDVHAVAEESKGFGTRIPGRR